MNWQLHQPAGTGQVTAHIPGSNWWLSTLCTSGVDSIVTEIGCFRGNPVRCELTATIPYPEVLMTADLAGWVRGSLGSILARSPEVEAWVMGNLV